jgi:hypothetical protein
MHSSFVEHDSAGSLDADHDHGLDGGLDILDEMDGAHSDSSSDFG